MGVATMPFGRPPDETRASDLEASGVGAARAPRSPTPPRVADDLRSNAGRSDAAANRDGGGGSMFPAGGTRDLTQRVKSGPTWTMLGRRGLFATVIGAGAAWMCARAPFLGAGRGLVRSVIGSNALAAVCSELNPPRALGEACLEALPAIEYSEASLTRAIIGEMRAAGRDCSSARALAQAIRERSRDDFRDGRIATVDGWMLSLTETRVYALAALLARPHETVG
jgi:hypothetical protein